MQVGLAGEHQHINASLALQLCKAWVEETKRGDHFTSKFNSAAM